VNFFEREGSAEHVFGETATGIDIMSSHWLIARVEAEAAGFFSGFRRETLGWRSSRLGYLASDPAGPKASGLKPPA
jgi:hypothetical protein